MLRLDSVRMFVRPVLLAVALLAAGPLVMQSTGLELSLREFYERRVQAPNEPVVPSGRSVNLTEEHRHTLREVILKDPGSKRNETAARVKIGDKVPENVSVHPFPALIGEKIPSLRSNSYFIAPGDEIVIVNPQDNTVADIVRRE